MRMFRLVPFELLHYLCQSQCVSKCMFKIKKISSLGEVIFSSTQLWSHLWQKQQPIWLLRSTLSEWCNQIWKDHCRRLYLESSSRVALYYFIVTSPFQVRRLLAGHRTQHRCYQGVLKQAKGGWRSSVVPIVQHLESMLWPALLQEPDLQVLLLMLSQEVNWWTCGLCTN